MLHNPKTNHKYIALASGNINFLEAALFFPEDGDAIAGNYKQARGLYLHDNFSHTSLKYRERLKSVFDHTRPIPFLLNLLRENYIFIPLDTLALRYAIQKHLRYKLVTDFIDIEKYAPFNQFAHQDLLNWTNAIDYKLANWTVNWLKNDLVYTSTIFNAAYNAMHLAASLKNNCEQLVVIRRQQPSFCDFQQYNDIAPLIWERELSDQVCTITYHNKTHNAQLNTLALQKDQDFTVLKDATVLGFYEHSYFRHTELIKSIMNKSSQRAVVHIIPKAASATTSVLDTAKIKMPCDVVSLELEANDLTQETLNYEQFIKKTCSDSNLNKDILSVFLYEYCTQRASYLERLFKSLHNTWELNRPKVCIAENIHLGEYALPILVANSLNIPSITVPHSTLHFMQKGYTALPASVVSHTYLKLAQQNASEKQSFFACNDINLENTTYQFNNNITLKKDSDKIVIIFVLTGILTMHMPLNFDACSVMHLRWLKESLIRSPFIKKNASVYYKVHPGAPDCEILLGMGVPSQEIIPPESSPHDILPQADIIVSLEFVSSPSFIGMKNNIPVITCLHHLNRQHFLINDTLCQLAASGLLIDSCELLWPSILKTMLSHEYRSSIIEQQKKCLEHHWQPGNLNMANCIEHAITL